MTRSRCGSPASSRATGPVAQRALHLHRSHDDIGGEVLMLAAEDVTGAQPGPGRAPAPSTPTSYAAALDRGRVLHRRLRRRRATAARRRTTSACCRTTRRWSGRPATTSSPRAVGQARRHRGRRWRWTSSWRSATTSTRAASCCSPASTPASRRRPDGAYYYNPFGAAASAPRPATYPCLPLLNDFQQYWLGAYSYVDNGGTDADGEPFPLGGTGGAVRRVHRHAQRRRLGEQPGPHGVVPDHVELPAAGAVPAVRQLGAGGVGPAGRRAVRPVHR